MEGLFENICVALKLHETMFAPVCTRFQLKRTELLVLLFLSREKKNTASDIVDTLKIAKSHISASVRDLEERRLVICRHEGRDHRAVHLQLCAGAADIIRACEEAQRAWYAVLCQDLTEQERQTLGHCLHCMTSSANMYLKEQKQAKVVSL